MIPPTVFPSNSALQPLVQSVRALAIRVIDQAFRDASNRSESAERTEAREFLAGSAMLDFWCEVGQLRSGDVISRAEALLLLPCGKGRAAEI